MPQEGSPAHCGPLAAPLTGVVVPLSSLAPLRALTGVSARHSLPRPTEPRTVPNFPTSTAQLVGHVLQLIVTVVRSKLLRVSCALIFPTSTSHTPRWLCLQ